MKESLFAVTLIAATALSFSALPAWATGDGSYDNPYSGSISGLDLWDSTWSADKTIYIDGITGGYIGTGNNAYTCVANIDIGTNGFTLTDGYSSATYTFSGSITGSGEWKFNKSTTDQKYTFTGDVSGYSGNFNFSNARSNSYLHFGDSTQAASNSQVSGTGSITLNGTLQYNYSGYASGTGDAISIDNSSISALNVQFSGSVNYEVNTAITGTGGTLTVSNTGTTTLNKDVSGFSAITVGSSSTLSVASEATLDISGATVDLSSTIQNSGTITVGSGTVFAVDNLIVNSGNWASSEGDGNGIASESYTLITNSNTGSVSGTDSLDTSSVSTTYVLTSVSFSYANGSLIVSVTGYTNGIHGDGTSEATAYFTSGTGIGSVAVTGTDGIFSGKAGTTVYLGTDEYSFGNASDQIYWSGEFTAACDVVIGAAGIYITDGSTGQSHVFTGAISGTGDFTVTHSATNGGSVNQDYTFTGDLSQWSGNFTIDTTNSSDYVHFGEGTVAATDTDVSGTGAVSVESGTIKFNYVSTEKNSGYGQITGPTTIVIGNSSLTATTIEFAGDITYSLDLIKTAISATNLSVDEATTLLIRTSGTLTESSTSSSIAVSGTLELAESVTLTVTKNIAASVSVENLVLGNGSTLDLSVNAGTDTTSKSTSIGTITLSNGTGTMSPSATITTDNWEEYVTIGAIVGSGTLILDAKGSMDHVTVYELTGTGTSSFSGTIDLTSTNGSTNAARGISLVISDASVAAGAVIEMGTENSYYSAIALGVNASTVEIAGLTATSSTGGDIIYSGAVSAGAQLGNAGATLIDYKGQTNYGEGSKFDNVGKSRNTLVINTAENATYSFSGVIMDMLNLEKSGAGTQSIEFKSSTYGSTGYYFDGTITVNAGTLNLSGVETNSSGITVADGTTLNIANNITLTKASDFESCTSTISGNLGLSGTLTVSSDATLEIGSTASVTINSAISNSGVITIADGASIVVGSDLASGIYNGADGSNYEYYVLITGSNSGSVDLNGNVTFVINGENITLSEITTTADGDTTWKGYTVGGYLVIYAETSTTAQTTDPLYWAGTDGNNTWSNQTTDTPWSATDGGSSGYYFAEGASVTFGHNEGSFSTEVVLGDNITAGTVNITGSGYTLTAGEDYTLTATTIILDDEETDVGTHTFTIGEGVKVQAGTLTEKAGQLDLVVNGELDVTTMTVSTTQDESISGSGKLSVETFEYSSGHGVSLTISVAKVEFGSITEQASETETSGSLRHLIFGNGTSKTTASVASMEIKGLSDLQVATGSELTITNLVDSSGWDTSISGGGSISIGSMTVSGEATARTLTISIASFKAGTISFTGTVGLTISSTTFTADSIAFTGGNSQDSGAGAITISGNTKATIGAIESTNNHTITIETGGELTTGSIYRYGSSLKLIVNGELSVTQLEGYTDSTGMIYFGKEGSTTSMAQSISGSGTVNVYGIEAYFASDSTNNLTISVANINIGEGGITESTGSHLHISGTTIGLYKATNVTIAANMVIDNAGGATFNMKGGETMTISGVLSGAGAIEKTGDGTLILSAENLLTGTVTISAGTVEVTNASALGSGAVSVAGGATLQLDTAISTTGTVTFSENAKLVISGDLLTQLATATLASSDSTAVSIITANTITFGDETLEEDFSDNETFNTLINKYVSAGNYLLSWTWDGGTLYASAVGIMPEPNLFGIFAGLATVAFTATRRRRRKAA